MEFYVDRKTNTYHRGSCECMKKLINPRSISTSSFSMYKLGYTPCRKCTPMYKYYDEHRDAIGKIALENGLKLRLRDESLLVDSPLSSWKIICIVTNTGEVMFKLYHENTQQYRNCDIVNGEVMKKYHDQETWYKTIEEQLKYIIKHDTYRTERNRKYKKSNNRTTKTGRYLYNRSKNRDISMSSRRVYNLIEELEIQRKNKVTNNIYE